MIYDDESTVLGEPVVLGRPSRLRLLTWRGPSGNRCYLSTDDEANSMVVRLANEFEEAQTETADQVLEAAEAVLDDPHATAQLLRFALLCTRDALADVLLVAESRGERLPPAGAGDEADVQDEDDPTLPAESF